MEKITLKTELRSDDESIKALRASRIIPAVVYWHKQESIKIKINNSDLLRAYRVAWENHIVNLEVDKKKIDVLFHEVQFNPITWDFLHIDFYAIVAWEKVHTHIPLSFINTSKAASEWAIIEELIKELDVKCLPTDLVDSFEVDLSMLENIWDNIKVWDLKISSKFEVLNSQDDVLIVASKPKVEKVNDETETSEETTEESK